MTKTFRGRDRAKQLKIYNQSEGARGQFKEIVCPYCSGKIVSKQDQEWHDSCQEFESEDIIICKNLEENNNIIEVEVQPESAAITEIGTATNPLQDQVQHKSVAITEMTTVTNNPIQSQVVPAAVTSFASD